MPSPSVPLPEGEGSKTSLRFVAGRQIILTTSTLKSATSLVFALFATLLLSGCASSIIMPQPTDKGIAFGFMGDTPYSDEQVRRLDRLIDDINAQELAFVVHVGDI